jgi:hypothetical protein
VGAILIGATKRDVVLFIDPVLAGRVGGGLLRKSKKGLLRREICNVLI